MGDVLRMEGVWKGFDRHHAQVPVLEDISLSVARGEVVAVVGGAGQGKSTLIELASGTSRPDRGRVQINDVDVTGLKDRNVSSLLAGWIGVATRNGPPMDATARDYIEMALGAPKDGRRRRWRRQEQRSMATAILHDLDIAECAPLRWSELSDWQRVLVELGQAVCVGPSLLLVDDIARDFGLREKQAATDVLEGFAQGRNLGVVMAVSDHASALGSDRVWQLHRRRLRLMANHRARDFDDADVVPFERRSDAAR